MRDPHRASSLPDHSAEALSWKNPTQDQPGGSRTGFGTSSQNRHNIGGSERQLPAITETVAESFAVAAHPTSSKVSAGATSTGRGRDGRVWVAKRKITPAPIDISTNTVTPPLVQSGQSEQHIVPTIMPPPVQTVTHGIHTSTPLTYIGESQAGQGAAGPGCSDTLHEGETTLKLQPPAPFFTTPCSGLIYPSRRAALNPALSSRSRWLDDNGEGGNGSFPTPT